MSAFQLWMQHLSNFLVGATGLVYAWFRYLSPVPAEDPESFVVAVPPAQALFQQLHLFFAPTLVFAVGLIWHTHVLGKFRKKARRRLSGIGLAATFVPMVASGYLIQTTVEEHWRTTWIIVHLITSGFWLAAYLVHQVAKGWVARRS